MGYGEDVFTPLGSKPTLEGVRADLEMYTEHLREAQAELAAWEVSWEQVQAALEKLAVAWETEISGVKLTLEVRGGSWEIPESRLAVELPEGMQAALAELKQYPEQARRALTRGGWVPDAFTKALAAQEGPRYIVCIEAAAEKAAQSIVKRAMDMPEDLRDFAEGGLDGARDRVSQKEYSVAKAQRMLAELEAAE